MVSPQLYPVSHTDSVSFFSLDNHLQSFAKMKKGQLPSYSWVGLSWEISGYWLLFKNLWPSSPIFISHSSLHPKVTNPKIPKLLGDFCGVNCTASRLSLKCAQCFYGVAKWVTFLPLFCPKLSCYCCFLKSDPCGFIH